MAGTVFELMEGLGIGVLSLVAIYAFFRFLESATDVICAATQKIKTPFRKQELT